MNSKLRIAGWLAVGGLLAAAFVSPASAFATSPDDHKIKICHATPPDTAADGYQVASIDIASAGHNEGGHEKQHDADIIPPYTYGDYEFLGKNWTAAGQAIYNNACVVPTTTTTTTTSSSETSTTSTDSETTATETTDETTTATETTDETTTATETTDQTTTSTETSSTETSSTTTGTQTTTSTTSHHSTTHARGGDPTLPPTDTVASSDASSSASGLNSVSLMLILAAGLLATILVLTPSTKGRRR